MTEHITTLLQEEADSLVTPRFDAGSVIADGRRIRRRRSGLQAVAVTAVAALVLAGAVAWAGLGDSDEPRPPTTGEVDQQSGWAVATGAEVQLPGVPSVDVGGQVKGLYYTSEGIVVRTGKSPYIDVPGGSHYALLTDDGHLTDLGLTLGDQTPATDPDEPYLAYSEPGSAAGQWMVKLVDVSTGEVVHSVPFEGKYTWAGWEGPPIALDGDHVYAGMDDATVDINVQDGSVKTAEGLPGSTAPDVRGGRMLIQTWTLPEGESQPVGESYVIDVATGERQEIPVDPDQGWATLSPDGTKVLIESERSARVYDVATGEFSDLPRGGGRDTGWTPDGGTLQVDKDHFTVCGKSGASYGCVTRPMQGDTGELRISGNSYES